MKAALQVALTWFNSLPVQRPLNVIGGSMLALSPLFGIGPTGFLGILGAVFLLITPAFCMGPALRAFSARNMVRLLPHGRAQVLCGTTLAITLMAVIAALPTLFAHMGGSSEFAHGRLMMANPLQVFATAWTCAVWICIVGFVASASVRSMLLSLVLVPLLAAKLSNSYSYSYSYLNHLLGPGAYIIESALGWLGFCAWYLRGQPIHPAAQFMAGMHRASPAPENPAAEQGPITRAAAMRQYLLGGGVSPAHSSLHVAAMTLLIVLLLWLLSRIGGFAMLETSMLIVGNCALIISVMLGYVTVQRARRLWLRAGLNREQLFRTAERMGATTTLLFVGIVAAGLAIWSLTQRPDMATPILLALPLQLALALCLFYACLGYTGNWAPIAALLDIAVAAWLLRTIFYPRLDDLPQDWLTILAITVALALLLRMRAQWRWRRLHLRPIPQMHRPAA